MDSHAVLGPRGLIAQKLPDYESRPQQLQMADAVADAVAARRHLMVEAGTGTGKSFAYLVPALLAALRDKECKVVVSTHTIALQEQLVYKDLPFLQQVLPPFRAVLVKGRSNYLSLRRLKVTQQKAAVLLSAPAEQDELTQLGRWSRKTADGTRSDLPYPPSLPVWGMVSSDSDNCLGRKCATYNECFYFKARKAMREAQLLVVNHALFFSDLALRRDGAGLLPNYQVAIFDEAHTLEDVAADHLGLQVTQGGVDHLLGTLFSPQKRKGLLAVRGDDAAFQAWDAARSASLQFFHEINEWLIRQGRGTGRVREANVIPDGLSAELAALGDHINRLAEPVQDPEQKIELTAACDRCHKLAASVKNWLGQSLAGQVYWVERPTERRLTLASAPVEVGPALKEQLYDKVPTVILTSATMSSGGADGFGHARRRLGLDDCKTLQLGSPFDYTTQAELHLFRKMPDPSAAPALFEQAVIDKIPEYVKRTGGRAFVLFTSYQFLQKAAQALRGKLAYAGLKLLCQGEGAAPQRLVEQFRATEGAVLFGVDSFWQGVDVKGDALVSVMITKLPFAVPDRPLTEARMEAIKRRGENDFLGYSVPLAALKLKQGFGRLIRTKRDRGTVVLFDPRVLTKNYGRAFLDALPPARRFIDGVESD